MPLIDLPAIYTGRPKDLPVIRPTLAQKADLAKINTRITDFWQSQIPAFMAAYNPTPLQLDSAPESESAIDEAARLANILVIGINPTLRGYGVRIVQWHKEKFARYAFAASGVDLTTVLSGAQSGDTVATFIARNMALIKDISATTQAKMSDVVFRGLQARTPARQVAKELQEVVAVSRKRAVRIASDQLQKLASQLDTERMLDVGIKKWKWRHSGKLHPRPEHKARDNVVYAFNKPPIDMPGELPYCFLGGQPVGFDGDVKKLWRRSYSGETTTLVTELGEPLCSTPNHPILTDSGWKAAKDINVGEYLIDTRFDGFDAFDLDIKKRQPRIADVFEAAKVAGVIVSTNGRGGEFHGDHIVNDNIDVIDFSDNGLRANLVSPVNEDLTHLILEKSEILSAIAIRQCLAHGMTVRGSSPTDSVLRGLNLIDALAWRQLSPNDMTGIACVADIYSEFDKSIGYGFSAYANSLTNRDDALARLIGVKRTSAVKLLGIASVLRASIDTKAAPSAESIRQIVSIDSNLSGGECHRATGVNFRYSKVKNIVSDSFSGQVYNLHTESNWYVAGSYAVHNCGCAKSAILG